jgi:hypothetical protein
LSDADALAETADIGWVYWRGDERDDWLKRQWAFTGALPPKTATRLSPR